MKLNSNCKNRYLDQASNNIRAKDEDKRGRDQCLTGAKYFAQCYEIWKSASPESLGNKMENIFE